MMWFTSKKKLSLPTADAGVARPRPRDAGADRALRQACAADAARSRPGCETAIFALGCFWGAERKFWQAAGRALDRGRLRRRRSRRTRPTRRSARARPATPRWCSSSSIPKVISYEALLKVFWESHDPTQGMRQGNDVGTQYRSGIYVASPEQRRRRRRRATPTSSVLTASGFGEITTEIADAPGVLLRRGLPPAVPGEEPRRLLRPRRHRRELPGRAPRPRPKPPPNEPRRPSPVGGRARAATTSSGSPASSPPASPSPSPPGRSPPTASPPGTRP